MSRASGRIACPVSDDARPPDLQTAASSGGHAEDGNAALDAAEKSGDAKNVDTKYFTATFYKKGTAHLVFKDMELLEKFNIFASQKEGWLPPSYGKKRYTDMNEEEKQVIDAFQGKDQYEKVIQRRDYYLNAQQTSPLMIMAPA